jgi:hypothetical protein
MEEKGKEIQGGKRRRGLIKRKRGIWVIIQKGKEALIKEDIGRRRRRSLEGRRFSEDQDH